MMGSSFTKGEKLRSVSYICFIGILCLIDCDKLFYILKMDKSQVLFNKIIVYSILLETLYVKDVFFNSFIKSNYLM